MQYLFPGILKEPNLFQWGKPLNAEILKIKKLLNTLKKIIKGMYIGGIIQVAGISRFYLIRIFKLQGKHLMIISWMSG